MERTLASQLTVRWPDTPEPARFSGPHGTVRCVVEEDVLNVYVKPDCHPADWDLARALMGRIADPATHVPGNVPSALAEVDWWSVELVAG